MRLIDADEVRREIARSSIGRNDSKWEAGYVEGRQAALRYIDAAPTVDVPQPLTRDGVLARSDKALRHDLAATFGSRLNREQTFTGAQVAAMLRDGEG